MKPIWIGIDPGEDRTLMVEVGPGAKMKIFDADTGEIVDSNLTGEERRERGDKKETPTSDATEYPPGVHVLLDEIRVLRHSRGHATRAWANMALRRWDEARS